MKRIFTILLLFVGVQGFAQHSSNAYRALADSLYVHHHYQVATDYYIKALKKSPHQGNIMLQLAKCYYKINGIAESEKWFISAQKNKGSFSTKDYYEFAQVLIMLKKREQADTLLEHVLKHDLNNNVARKALEDLRNYKQYYRDSSACTVVNLPINTSASEFAPAYYKDGIVFTSSRHEGAFKKKSHWDNSPFLNLYYAGKTPDQRLGEPTLFEDDLDTRHHDGPATFYSQHQRMIINRNQRVEVEGRENVFEWRPGLYDARLDVKKSSWEVVPLPFNDPAYSFLHPAISEDGTVLYFASDKPGGFGGTDIYRTTRTNGVWGPIVNLGPIVNSAEDEAFPFLVENTLYFTSNGWGGLGGLDLFKCELSPDGISAPVNLGYPINSTSDDFSLIINPEQRSGYFASARNGNDDIFSFQMLTNVDVLAMGRVTNILGELVSGHKAIVTEKSTGDTLAVETDKGSLTFLGERGKAYDVTVAHENYQTTSQELNIPKNGPETENFSILLKNKDDGSGSELLVVDTEQGTSKMYITSGKSLTEITEKDSLLYLKTPKGNEYLTKGNLSKIRTDPSPVLKKLGMEKSDRTNLRNIYFDFDMATLDEEDKIYLDQVKMILEHDRSLKLLIAGHADDRGDEDYNIGLSQRRVQVVTKYLAGHGISKDRIIQKAYGESLPVVPCYAVDCSEEDHQKNRRAEFVLRNDNIHTSAPRFSNTPVAAESNQ
ncbi:OmpA family protein [Chryseolinea sp. H1M3-3]|uniref:OmpA family protein n=1 Tax=Chryseolinea sp. H1M3-3 TaxID=3034144 RepID=UPI0023ED16E4|nr:OmpA family protein [Chryseolinea sp. H1M3-3]